MSTTFFNNAYFLQSIGWAIGNSFWQTGLLWLLYLLITGSDKQIASLLKYHFSLLLLVLSFLWFVVTAGNNYVLLLHTSLPPTIHWLNQFQQINQLLPFAALVYFMLLVLYTFQFIRHYLKIRFVGSRGLSKPPLELRLFTLNTGLHLGIKKKVTLWLSEHVEVPSVIGIVKPIILLPFSILSNLSSEQINAILVHELAHIKRNDYLLNLIHSLFALLLFFNPFAVLLSKSIKRERENCCDDWVLTYQFNRVEYAKALLVLEEQRQQHVHLMMTATSNKKLLLYRIKRLLLTNTPATDSSLFQKCKLVGLGLLLLTAIFLMVPYITADQTQLNSTNKIPGKNSSFLSGTNFLKTKSEQTIFTRIVGEKGISTLSSKKSTAHSAPVSKKRSLTSPDDKDYLLVFVNEDELLNKKQSPEAMPTTISNPEKDSLQSSLFVKIEEEQSGKTQINTYYFSLHRDKLKTEIKPLLILKKYKAALHKNGIKKLNQQTLTKEKKRIST